MLPSHPTGTPRPQPRCSRRDFLVVCLGFVGVSCASARSTTHPPPTVTPSSPVTATPSPPQTTVTTALTYHGTYTGHEGQVWGVSWSPDGKRIASASADGTVQVWDPNTGRTLLTLGTSGIARWAVTWSPDGRRIVSAFGNDLYQNGAETIGVWDATTGRTLLVYNGHSSSTSSVADGVLGLAWSRDGTRIASGGADATVHIWDARTGRRLALDQRDHKPVWDVAWSPDDKRLAVASWDGTVIIWQPPG